MDIVWNEVLVLARKWIDLDDITELKEANQDANIIPSYLYKFSGVGNRDRDGATDVCTPTTTTEIHKLYGGLDQNVLEFKHRGSRTDIATTESHFESVNCTVRELTSQLIVS